MSSTTLLYSVLARAPLSGQGWRPTGGAIAPHCILYTALTLYNLQHCALHCILYYTPHCQLTIYSIVHCTVYCTIHRTVSVILCFRSFYSERVGKSLVRDKSQPLKSVLIIAKMLQQFTENLNFCSNSADKTSYEAFTVTVSKNCPAETYAGTFMH